MHDGCLCTNNHVYTLGPDYVQKTVSNERMHQWIKSANCMIYLT